MAGFPFDCCRQFDLFFGGSVLSFYKYVVPDGTFNVLKPDWIFPEPPKVSFGESLCEDAYGTDLLVFDG